MSYTPSQRSAIQQFSAFTNASDRTAVKFLKNHSWNVEVAADSYFNQNGRGGSTAGGFGAMESVNKAAISKIFDQYRQPDDPLDQFTINGVMEFLQVLGLSLEDPTVLALCEALNSPTMGEMAREGFVDGWKTLGCDSLDKMKAYIPQLRQNMTDEAFFKKVYLWTFGWARTEGQKGLPLEVASEWWRLLFQHRFANHLESWLTFLTEKWNKSVPKDTWNMLYDFVLFAEKDPKLESYDEEGAWPSVIDSYVEYYRRSQS